MYHESEGGIENIVPMITDWQTGRIFLSHPYTDNGFLFLFTIKYRISIFQTNR